MEAKIRASFCHTGWRSQNPPVSIDRVHKIREKEQKLGLYNRTGNWGRQVAKMIIQKQPVSLTHFKHGILRGKTNALLCVGAVRTWPVISVWRRACPWSQLWNGKQKKRSVERGHLIQNSWSVAGRQWILMTWFFWSFYKEDPSRKGRVGKHLLFKVISSCFIKIFFFPPINIWRSIYIR